jgi:hypothetical protein
MSQFFMGTSVVAKKNQRMARLLLRSLLPLVKGGGVSPVPQIAMDSQNPQVGPGHQLHFPVVKNLFRFCSRPRGELRWIALSLRVIPYYLRRGGRGNTIPGS